MLNLWALLLCTQAAGLLNLSSYLPTREEQLDWDRQRLELKKKLDIDRGPFPRTARRMGVCVVGQMERLELRSKVLNLLLPNSDFLIDVVLVASHSAFFANAFTDTGYRMGWTKESIRSYLEKEKKLAETNGRRLYNRLIIDDAEQEPAPLIIPEYEHGARKEKPTTALVRIQSHVRQWLSMLQCYRHFQSQKVHYDVIVKVRDDSFVLTPWNIAKLNYSGTIRIPECLGWRGYNDKVAVLDSQYAEAFFSGPVTDYYFNYSALNITAGQHNPESILKAALKRRKAKVRLAHIDDMPVFTSRFEHKQGGQNISCFVFSKYKLGDDKKCFPTSCELRAKINCLACKREQRNREAASFRNLFFDPRPNRSHVPVPGEKIPCRPKPCRPATMRCPLYEAESLRFQPSSSSRGGRLRHLPPPRPPPGNHQRDHPNCVTKHPIVPLYLMEV